MTEFRIIGWLNIDKLLSRFIRLIFGALVFRRVCVWRIQTSTNDGILAGNLGS